MALLRDIAQLVRVDLELATRTPIRRGGDYQVISNGTPADYGLSSARNSAVEVQYGRWASIVTYNRKDIAQHFGATKAKGNWKMRIHAPSVKRLVDLLPDLNRHLDAKFKESDIVDAPVTITFATTSVTFTMAPSNLLFTGTLTVDLDGRYLQDGDQLLYDYSFDARPWVHPTADPARALINGGLLTYPKSYITQNAALAAIPVRSTYWSWENLGAASSAALAAALSAVDGLPWISDTTSNTNNTKDFNLAYCSVIYNGPVEGFEPHIDPGFTNNCPNYWQRHHMPRKDHTHVLVVHPNANYAAKNLRYSPIFIHYGELVPETHWAQPDLPPRHRWQLAYDRLNTGADPAKPVFPDCVYFMNDQTPQYAAFFKRAGHLNGGGMCALKAQGNWPLGTTIDTTKDFTLSFWSIFSDANTAQIGWFGNAGGADYIGSVKSSDNGYFWINGFTTKWEAKLDSRSRYGQRTRVTMVKRGNRLLIYFNDQLTAEQVWQGAALGVITHIGRVNQYLTNNIVIGDIRIFDYALNHDQVKRINRGLF